MKFNVRLTKADLEQCQNFVHNWIDTSKDEYFRRNQTNVQKLIDDHVQGKLAEIAVYRVFSNLEDTVTEPDFKIYSQKLKSFDRDLLVNGWANFHVKSISKASAAKFGVSWMFQKKDPLCSNPSEDDWIVPVIMDELSASVLNPICSLDIIWGEPKLEKLRGNKVSFYVEDNPHVTRKVYDTVFT